MSALDSVALSPSRRGLLTAALAGGLFLPFAFLFRPETNGNSLRHYSEPICAQCFCPH